MLHVFKSYFLFIEIARISEEFLKVYKNFESFGFDFTSFIFIHNLYIN